MAIDDDRLARMLVRERDRLLQQCALPSARQALFRARVGASRRRAARVSGLIDRLALSAVGLLAMTAAVVTLLYVPLSDHVFAVVAGALSAGGIGVLTAFAAMQAATFTEGVNRRG
jgi:hypothetical protein